MKSFLTPPMRKGNEPPFYEMGAMPFQELCRDLLAVQGEFIDCRIYGDNGEGQFGIDIRCDRKSYVLEVAQAKCYKNFPPADIKDASNKFFESIEQWQREGVKKFILIVACRISSKKANDQIAIERQRFAEFGIDYELWDAIRIRDILREHCDLIYTHIENDQFWAERICGPVTSSPYSNQVSFGVNQILATDLNSALSVISSKASEELVENRAFWRAGKKRTVIEWINNKKSNPTEWKFIDPKIKAGIVRLEASIYIDHFEDLEKAESLLVEAKELDPDGPDRKLWAILTLHRSGLVDGLLALGDASDIDSKCVRTSLLLQQGRLSEAINLLEQLQVETNNNAEVFRLLALYYLETKDLLKARETINQAKQIEDDWESIQIADAVISYYSALSPAAFSRTSTIWPEPIELDLVKSSSEAIHALEYAAEVFQKVYQNEFTSETQRLSLKIWHAACLACDFRLQAEAENFFNRLLIDNPTDHRIISWVFYRRYPFDLQKSRQELKRTREKDLASVADIISSVILDILHKKVRNTLYLLENNKRGFITEGLEQLWDFWRIQTLIAQKRLSEANNLFQESSFREQLQPLQLLLLNLEGNESGNYDPFISLLVKLYEEDKDSLALMEMCQYFASKQKWQELSLYSEPLVSEIQTVKAFKIGIAALYNQGLFQECKLYIEQHRSLCYENNLPSDIILIYIQSKARAGEFPEALSDLRQITESNPTKQNLLLLRDFYLRKGDKVGLREVAFLVKKQPDFIADELIQFAKSLLWASPELAIEMIRMAPSDQLSSQQVVEKMMLGFSLGLDSELKDIHTLFPGILASEDSPIRMATLEETVEIMKQRHHQQNELFAKYSAGEIPIHFLSRNAGSNLFTLYKIAFSNNNFVQPRQKFPLYIRYGGKPSLVDFKEPDKPIALDRISLDITTLLLMDHFALLDIFEDTENPIIIPSETVHALINMKHALEQHQPDIVQASKLLLEYLNENRIRNIDVNSNQFSGDFDFDRLSNLVDSLEGLQGYIVGFSSQINTWNRINSNKSNLIFIALPDIVESLRDEAIISEVEKKIVTDQLGTEGLTRSNVSVPQGSNLFFVANTIRLLAQTGFLKYVCTAYTVWTESSEISDIQSSLSEERDRSEFATSLQNLIDRVSKGIEDRKYIFLPQQKWDNKTEALAQEDILLRNLFDNFTAGQNSIILPAIDDFFIQKQLYSQGSHVIGIYELVWSAYKQGVIDEIQYYDLLIEFRKSDLRYIPISSDEVFFHIRKAPIENNAVQESPKLRILKEYTYSSLLVGRKLLIPKSPFDSLEAMGEFEYLFSFVHSIAYSLTKIWQDKVPEEQKQIRSLWIFENLYLDILSLCHIAGWEREPKDHVFLVALGLAEFFLNGLQFPQDNSDDSPRKQFYDWFYRIICEPRFNANPGLLERTAEFIKNSLASQIAENANSDFDPYIRLLSERLYQDLPNPIKEIINTDKKFLEQIGIEILSVIEVAGFKFSATDFWEKLAHVIKGHPTPIWSVDPKVEILFSPYNAKKNLGVTFVHPNNGGNINVESGDFVFILNSNWQVWLDCNSDYFTEWSKNELAAIISQICLGNSPAERMEGLYELRKSSIGSYYHNLREELQTTQVLNFDHLLPPSRQSLRQFFGFGSNDNSTVSTEALIDKSARDLLKRLGLLTAVSRVAAFPVEIPVFLVDEIKELPIEERDTSFSKLFTTLVTPISRLHLIKLAMQFGYEEQMSNAIQSFFTEDINNEISAFFLLLGWVSDTLDSLPGDDHFSLEEKLLLSWGHTNEIFGIFKQVSIPFDWLIDILKEKKTQLPFRYIFSAPLLEWEDVVYASRLDALAFKIQGLNYALGGSRTLRKEEQELLFKEVFPWKENVALPAIDLLEQRESFTNVLQSFFGMDISSSLQHLTSDEGERISPITNSSLRNLASQAIDWLSSPVSAIAGFQFLFGIYHTQALPEDLLGEFEKNISTLNFAELINESPMVAILGFYFSSCQARYLSERAKNRLFDELLVLAEAGSKLSYEANSSKEHSLKEVEIIAMLFESAIQLSKSLPEEAMIDEFGRLIIGTITRWIKAKTIGIRLLNRLYQDIPIPISHKLGKILIEVRLLR